MVRLPNDGQLRHLAAGEGGDHRAAQGFGHGPGGPHLVGEAAQADPVPAPAPDDHVVRLVLEATDASGGHDRLHSMRSRPADAGIIAPGGMPAIA
jgi:hypothetical protein